MTTNRIKLPTTIISRDRAEQILGEIAVLKIEQRREQNKMDAELTRVRERYELSLAATGKAIEDKTVLLESWAAANPGEFPKDRKSIALTHGVLGYRTGMPKLKTLAKWTWDRVLTACDTLGFHDFIRTKREVNKDAIIHQATNASLSAQELKALGVQVVQEETFFVEVKLEEQSNREEVAA